MLSFRSLSELEGIRVGGETSEKIRQVTERATLFRITSNAMINVRQLHMYYKMIVAPKTCILDASPLI